MKKKIGTYQLGYRWVDLYYDPETTGGNFTWVPKGKSHSEMVIGFNYGYSDKPYGTLFHEALEAAAADVNGRFNREGFDGDASDVVVFMFDHNQHSEISARVSYFIKQCHEDFFKAWKAHRHSLKKKTSTRGK